MPMLEKNDNVCDVKSTKQDKWKKSPVSTVVVTVQYTKKN